MKNRTVSYMQGHTIYQLGENLDSWAQEERAFASVQHGDVRVIKGILMFVYSIYKIGSNPISEINWIPVDKEFNTIENLKQWINS